MAGRAARHPVKAALVLRLLIQSAFGVPTHRDTPPALGISRQILRRKTSMKTLIVNSLNHLQKDETGQGLVEYLLIIALVAFAATAGMTTLASGLNSAFTKIGSILGEYIS